MTKEDSGWQVGQSRAQSNGSTRRNNPSRVVLIQEGVICWRKRLSYRTHQVQWLTCATPFPEVLINDDDIH